MKTIGNISKFAVSYELNQKYGGSWLFGKFCYWIGGRVIGDYELGTSLRDMTMVLPSIVKDNGNRENYCLFNLTAKELYKRLHNSLFGNEENFEYSDTALEECWARFNICPAIDIFDGYGIYLIDSPPKARIVYSFIEEEITEVRLEAGIFDCVIQQFYNTLLNMYETEVVKESS